MNGERAGIFDTEDEFDVSGFAPKAPPQPAVKPEQVRAVSEVANFRSREVRPAVPMPIEASTRTTSPGTAALPYRAQRTA